VNGYFEQGNYLSRKTNFIDIWNMQPVCTTGQHKFLWSALELSTSRRWLYGVLVQTHYVGLLSFCLHSTGLLRIYVCCSLNAVQANSERNASYSVIMFDSLHCYWCGHSSSSYVRGDHCGYSPPVPLTTHLVFSQSAVTFHPLCVN
jgi:hypothetical protein